MEQNLKDQWVKDLRSGDYKQTTGALERRGENNYLEYCCPWCLRTYLRT